MASAATRPTVAAPCSRTQSSLRSRHRLVAEGAGEAEHGDHGQEADEVHAVGGLEPLDAGHSAGAAVSAQVAQYGRISGEGRGDGAGGVGHGSCPVATGRDASADQPDQEAGSQPGVA